MIKDKRAIEEEWLSPWMFLIWFLILIGVYAGVTIYYSSTVDVRSEEASILTIKLADCIVANGYLQDISQDNIFDKCSLNSGRFSSGGDFYFEILVNGKKISAGESDLKMQCSIKTGEEKFASCSKKTIHALDQTNRDVSIEILGASNQREK